MKMLGKKLTLAGMCLVLLASILAFSYFPIKSAPAASEKSDYIRYVEFNPCYSALDRALTEDIRAHEEGIERSWIDTLAYLGAKYGGDFSRYRAQDMDDLFEKLDAGSTMEELTDSMKYYS